jgi:hypothetical protein
MTMVHDTQEQAVLSLKDALRHLRAGLDLLDRAGAPGQIGAHVDLAIHKLEGAIAAGKVSERYEA